MVNAVLSSSPEGKCRNSDTYNRRLSVIWSNAYSTTKRDSVVNCGKVKWIQRNDLNEYRIVTNGCNLRWCPKCRPRLTRPQRNRVIQICETSTAIRLITLTLKSTDDDLQTQIKRLQASFRRLRQTKLWKGTQEYGIAIIEVTYSNSRNQWHPHLHVLSIGSYLPQKSLSICWKKSTGDSTIADVRRVTTSHIRTYITKYLSKCPPVEKWNDPEKRAQEIKTAFSGCRSVIVYGRVPDLPEPEQTAIERWTYVAPLPYIVKSAFRGESWASQILIDMKDCSEVIQAIKERPP